jgi:plastocyanin
MNDVQQSKGNVYVVGGIIALVAVIFVFAYKDKGVVTLPTESVSPVDTVPVVKTEPVKTEPVKTTNKNASDKSVWPSPVETAPAVVKPSTIPIMTYTTKGFNPMVLEIKRGQSVRFVNGSGGSMRLISNTDGGQNPYPAFSQSKTVGPGGIYEFTFTMPGTWGFKNQFDAAHIGAVAVQ